MPDLVPGTESKVMNQTDQSPSPQGASLLV